MIKRSYFVNEIEEAFEVHSVCGILGPRQCGKTTLAKYYAQEKQSASVHYFDLEDPTDLSKLESPKLILEPLEGLIIHNNRITIFTYKCDSSMSALASL